MRRDRPWLLIALAAGALLEAAARLVARRSGRYALTPHARSEHAGSRGAAEPPPTVRIGERGGRAGRRPAEGEQLWRALVIGGSAAESYMLDQEDLAASPRADLQTEPGPLGGRAITWAASPAAPDLCLPDAHAGGILPRYRSLDLLITYAGASDVVAWMGRGARRVSSPEVRAGPVPVGPDEAFGWTPGTLALRRLAVRATRLLRPVERRSGVGGTVGRNRRMRAAATTLIDELPEAEGCCATSRRSSGAW